MTTAEREFADPRKSAFIRGFYIFRSEPLSALFVFSSIGSLLILPIFLIKGRTIGLPRRLHASVFPSLVTRICAQKRTAPHTIWCRYGLKRLW